MVLKDTFMPRYNRLTQNTLNGMAILISMHLTYSWPTNMSNVGAWVCTLTLSLQKVIFI